MAHHQRLDVIQDSFAKLLASRPQFPSEAAQLAWLRRVASNLAVDHHRRAARAHTPPAPEPFTIAPTPAEPDAALHASLATLSEMQRLVLLAKCVDNCTFAEIARHLDIAVPTAKTHYLRGLESLRRQVLPLHPELSETRTRP